MLNGLKREKERNRLRFFTNMVYTFFVFCIFLLLAGVFINIAENKGNVRESYIFNKRPTIVITGSMDPTIVVNSIVLLEPVEFEDLEVGDIIRYTSYQGYSILHRVISKHDTYVATKGDANERADSFVVTPAQVTGRVTEIHNEYAGFLTFLFGQFQYEAMGQSVLRACAGFIGLGIFVSCCIVMSMLIFETITTTYFFLKYKEDLVESSSYWVDYVPMQESQKDILLRYQEKFKEVNPIKKIILAYKFRKYYNGLCNIERETRKASRWVKNLNKWLN